MTSIFSKGYEEYISLSALLIFLSFQVLYFFQWVLLVHLALQTVAETTLNIPNTMVHQLHGADILYIHGKNSRTHDLRSGKK